MPDDAKRMPAEELFKLAQATVDELVSRVGIEGAIVIVVRKSDSMQGGALRSHSFNMETMFATGIKALLDMREDALRAAAAGSVRKDE